MDIKEAHKYSANHKKSLLSSEKAGCFYCLEIYTPDEIKDWLEDQAAVCPKCSIDAVIGNKYVPEMDRAFLQSMNEYWFSPEGVELNGRALSYDENEFLELVAENAPGNFKHLFDELDKIRVCAECDCGCPSVIFDVDADIEPTTVLEGDGFSYEGIEFGFIILAKGDQLSELDFYSKEEELDFSIPRADRINFY